jgi:hypothetical protein
MLLTGWSMLSLLLTVALAHRQILLQEPTLMCPQEQAAMRLALGLLASAATLQRQPRRLQQPPPPLLAMAA